MTTQFQADLAPTQYVDGPQGETFAYRRLGTPGNTPTAPVSYHTCRYAL